MTAEETWELNSEQLWAELGRELLASEIGERKKTKYLAILSSTRYVNTKHIVPFSHAHALSLTRGQVTLGGGGLALAGAACLWTWPTCIADVQKTLRDTTLIDSREVLDDSAYRGTVGGCYATTLGSVLHELGHCFDLGHTESGIMERGFDQLDTLLTVGEAAKVPKQSCGRRLAPCGGEVEEEEEGREEERTPRFTIVRRSSSVSRYLEEYQQRRRGEVATSLGGDCRWGRSAALLLARQPWLGATEASGQCKGEAGRQGEQVAACCTLAVAELRGERGAVRHWWEGGEGVTRLPLPEVRTEVARAKDDQLELVVAMACGRLLRLQP